MANDALKDKHQSGRNDWEINKKGGHWRPPDLNQLGRRKADPTN
jgi:hypothetical protein